LRVLPTAAVVGVAWALAWATNGSIDAGDWLPYALIVCVVLVAALVAGIAVVPARLPLVASALLVGFGLWTAVSIAWSPLPSLARDDALLVLLYAGAFLVPLLTLRSQPERLLAGTVVVLALGLLAFVAAVETATASNAADTFTEARLDFPVSYWNGAAALFLVGAWPAVALSADRRLGPVLRALAMGSAMAMVTAWLMTQSKGGGVALAVSGVVFLAVARERVRALVPIAIVGGLAAVGADALTAPYRASGSAELTAVHHAGKGALVLTGITLGCGLVYAVADRYLAVPRPVAQRIGSVLAAALALGAVGGVIGFFVAVEHPNVEARLRVHAMDESRAVRGVAHGARGDGFDSLSPELSREGRHADDVFDRAVHRRFVENPGVDETGREPRRSLHFIDDLDATSGRDIGNDLANRIRSDVDRRDPARIALAQRRGGSCHVGNGVGGWWLVAGGWWLVVGGWWLVVGGWWLVIGGPVIGGW